MPEEVAALRHATQTWEQDCSSKCIHTGRLTRWRDTKLAHDVLQPAGVIASSNGSFTSTACKKFARQSHCVSVNQLGSAAPRVGF